MVFGITYIPAAWKIELCAVEQICGAQQELNGDMNFIPCTLYHENDSLPNAKTAIPNFYRAED